LPVESYHARGCDNNEIGMLWMPLRAGSKAIICFAYTDVGK